MACGGFTCSRYSLVFLNILYIFIAFILITVAAYGKVMDIVVTLHVLGGVIACGVFLILVSIVGLVGALKHHQVLLFFYMIILFLLFLVQFSVACACLVASDAQQQQLYDYEWKNVPATRSHLQNLFVCCGHNNTNQNVTSGDFGHPSCHMMDACKQSTAKCCQAYNDTSSPYTNDTLATLSPSLSPTSPPVSNVCPLPDCFSRMEHDLHQITKVAGGLGLLFAFTEIVGVWLTYRYRNQKNPKADPSAFL